MKVYSTAGFLLLIGMCTPIYGQAEDDSDSAESSTVIYENENLYPIDIKIVGLENPDKSFVDVDWQEYGDSPMTFAQAMDTDNKLSVTSATICLLKSNDTVYDSSSGDSTIDVCGTGGSDTIEGVIESIIITVLSNGTGCPMSEGVILHELSTVVIDGAKVKMDCGTYKLDVCLASPDGTEALKLCVQWLDEGCNQNITYGEGEVEDGDDDKDSVDVGDDE